MGRYRFFGGGWSDLEIDPMRLPAGALAEGMLFRYGGVDYRIVAVRAVVKRNQTGVRLSYDVQLELAQ